MTPCACCACNVQLGPNGAWLHGQGWVAVEVHVADIVAGTRWYRTSIRLHEGARR